MEALLILAGLAGLAVGVIGIAKGSLPMVHLAGRKQAALLIAGSFVAVMAGGALGEPASDPTSQETPRPTADAEPSPSPSPTAEPDLILVPPDGSAATPQGQPTAAPTGPRASGIPPEAREAVVVRHVDGDTIWAEGGTLPGAAASSIRLLQVDTPESTNRTDCYGPEASAFTKAELPIGSKIYLLADREDKDRYGRFLRYIWKPDGEFFNEKLAREGYAKAVLFMPNDRYIAVMRAAEAEARAVGRGLWSACSNAAPPPPAPPAPPPPPAPPAPGDGCDGSYPDVCIAPYPPDLDCPQIPHRRFRVLQPDPHGFDRDQDGIGCESG